ncbi:hypothetical protein PVAND_011230 [Polypedilum vanderplanki]|uniref:Uncharacterized protein n=1 Tax=Polypedilum vanderplanki TaxID=319348 RepID=A0A9J6CJR9_POLVA|nr:hypothetical protein PVAND_011230 [Polypedilum vanderplanki]
MRIYLFLLVKVFITCGISFAIQFEDEISPVSTLTNLEQTKIEGVVNEGRGFFPSNDEPNDDNNRYSEISGIKYVADDYETFNSENRKQLNFNGNLPVRSPPTQTFLSENQFYQQQQPVSYRPSSSEAINSIYASSIRKQKQPKFPYQLASPSNYYYPSTQTDLSNPFYQNYANYYQYPSSSSLPYNYYYSNPTRYTSQSANLYGHPLHQQQQQQQSQYPNYYTNNYANQYGYQRPPSSSLYANNGIAPPAISNFINNVRDNPTFGQLSTVGSQFSKALEDISINDDLQCVPKLLCQMIRNPSKPNQLPSFLNIPGMTAIISALPSTSPLMNFGRAALLGLGGGQCDSAYPKCPRDDNQLLYYLNNHRGGFFRFFNGGNSFGEVDEESVLNQQLNQQQASQGLNMLALQALADTLSGSNGGSGFNLNNLLGSQTTQRPIASSLQNYQGLQADQNAGLLGIIKPSVLSDVVSNLLTGVIGNRFSRRLSKRSITDDAAGHKIQRRIVNLKDYPVSFFEESGENKNQQNTLYDDLNEQPLKFSNDNRLTSSQQPFLLKFPKESQSGKFVTSADVEKRIKMLFPDVDNFSEQFHQNLLRLIINDQRYGKILTGGQRPQTNSNNNLSYYSINRYPISQSQSHKQQQYAGSSSSGSSNYNNYNSNNRQPQYTTNSHNNNNSDRSHIVYVTNAQGHIEYTLNELTGEKKRYL